MERKSLGKLVLNLCSDPFTWKGEKELLETRLVTKGWPIHSCSFAKKSKGNSFFKTGTPSLPHPVKFPG